jgi:type VI secretion system protein
MALFEKFGPHGRAKDQRAGEPDRGIKQILENLENVLNTRRGYGSILQDFGISHISQHGTREHLAHLIIEEVKQNIEKYEPRIELENITYEESNNPLRLSFKISGRVRHHEKCLRLIFDTVFGAFDVVGAQTA